MRQKGFVPILIILIVLVSIGGAYYFATQKSIILPNLTQIPTTVATSTPTQIAPTARPTTDPTENWKTFTNSEYAFSFKYPSDWKMLDIDGAFMIAPNSNIESVDKMIKENAYEGGKNLVLLLKFPEGSSGALSNEYWDVTNQSIQVDNKPASKYTSINIQDVPSGKYFKGDVETLVVIPLKDKYALNLTLVDKSYDQIFYQILSTFKFTE